MIKQLQLLEIYLCQETIKPEAKKYMLVIYIKVLLMAELALFIITTPLAVISIYVLLMLLILYSIHLIPRWKEVGFSTRSYIIPYIMLIIINAITLPYTHKAASALCSNFFRTANSPLLMISFCVLVLLTYCISQTEKYDKPKRTLAKRILFCLSIAYFLFFGIKNPLSDYVLRSALLL
ncbi:MAG: hypothetical protein Q4E74_07860 [Ruminococcus sp.]|nr:hypothetical protein [Ruminococcus sp.]